MDMKKKVPLCCAYLLELDYCNRHGVSVDVLNKAAAVYFGGMGRLHAYSFLSKQTKQQILIPLLS